jgi:Transposase IS66 family
VLFPANGSQSPAAPGSTCPPAPQTSGPCAAHLPAQQRLAARKQHVASLVTALETWMRAARSKMSRHADVAKAMDYMLKRWQTFSRFLDDGRICLARGSPNLARDDQFARSRIHTKGIAEPYGQDWYDLLAGCCPRPASRCARMVRL